MGQHATAFQHLAHLAALLDEDEMVIALAREFRQAYQPLINAITDHKKASKTEHSTISSLWKLAESNADAVANVECIRK